MEIAYFELILWNRVEGPVCPEVAKSQQFQHTLLEYFQNTPNNRDLWSLDKNNGAKTAQKQLRDASKNFKTNLCISMDKK